MKVRLPPWANAPLVMAHTAGLLVCLVVIFFGVSLSDEGHAVAYGYRFALGDRPFLDDLTIVQGAAFLLVPFIKAFVWITGGTAAIVPFCRILFLLFQIGCAGLLFGALRTFVRPTVAFSIAALAVYYVPWQIPQLTYNSVATLAFATGFFLLLPTLGTKWQPFLAGSLHALGLLANPTYLVPLSLFFIGALAVYPADRRNRLGIYFAGGCSVTLALSPWLIQIVRDDFHFIRMAQSFVGTSVSLYQITRWLLVSQPYVKWFLAAGVAFLVFARRNQLPGQVAMCLVLLLLPLRVLFSHPNAASFYWAYFAFSAPVFWLAVNWREARNRYLAVGWIASAVAAVTISYTSTNLEINSGIGFFLGAIIAYVLIAEWAGERGRALVTVAILLGSLVCIGNRFRTYEEGPIWELRDRVTSGPYRWLFTTSERKSFLTELEEVVSQVKGPGRILFYEHLTAGFLFTTLPPLPTYFWAVYTPAEIERDERLHPGEPLYLVRVYRPQNSAWRRVNPLGEIDLDKYVQSRFTLMTRSPRLALYRSR